MLSDICNFKILFVCVHTYIVYFLLLSDKWKCVFLNISCDLSKLGCRDFILFYVCFIFHQMAIPKFLFNTVHITSNLQMFLTFIFVRFVEARQIEQNIT